MSQNQTTTVVLKQPITLQNGQELGEITLRSYKAGDAARARAFIAKSKAYGPECVNDNVILSLVMLRFCALPSGGVLELPMGWADELGGADFSEVVDAHEALSQGFESVEAYRAHVKVLIADAELEREKQKDQSFRA